jgi:DUF4097 and DUF4098 domain-containing protein YvlB
MKSSTKILLIVAASLMVIGLVVFLVVMTMAKWDFSKLSTEKYETNAYNIEDAYTNISIISDTADIEILPSEDGKSRVVCYEAEKRKHSVSVDDGTLLIELSDTRKWYEYIGFNFSSPKITVYLPEREYGTLAVKESTGDIKISKDFTFESIDLSLSTGHVSSYASAKKDINVNGSTGDVCIENISAGSLSVTLTTGKVSISDLNVRGELSVNVSTGKTYIKNTECEAFNSNGSTGDVTLEALIARGKISVERTTGDVTFKKSDASEIFVKVSTGDVKGNVLTDKVFVYHTSTGDVCLPESTSGGIFKIETTTGDVMITVG